MVKLQPSFIKSLLSGPQDAIHPSRLYQCSACYRPCLEPEFVAVISHGEAYCRGCIKEVI